jgi:hypothetical protein
MKKDKIDRKELYELVWDVPLTKLAEEFGIGVDILRKKCHRNEIPLPPMGYWSKLKYGKKVNKTPLSDLGQNESTITISNDIQINVDDYTIPFVDRLNYIKREIQSSENLPLTIPKSLKNPHKIVQRTKDYYQNLNQGKPIRYSNSNEGIISINVSKGNMNRALIIMDYFIKLVIARGHDVKVHYGSLQATMFTTHEEFSIREKYNTTRFDKYPYEKREAAGILVFKAGYSYHKTWEDSKSKSLEEKIPSILAWFEASARELKAHWDENAKREKEEEEHKRKEQEIKEQKENEIRKFNNLLDEAERWHKTQILREYITYLEFNNISNQDDFQDWLVWAKNKADWYDPIVKKEDDILGCFTSDS